MEEISNNFQRSSRLLLTLLMGLFFFRNTIYRETILLNVYSIKLNILFHRISRASLGQPNFETNEAKKIAYALDKMILEETVNPRIWQKSALLNTWRGNTESASIQWRKTDETVRDIIRRGLISEDFPNGSVIADIWYQVGLKINPEIRDLWFYQGVSYRNSGQAKKAIELFQNSLLSPDSYEIGLGDVFFQLAKTYRNEGKLEIALDYIEKAFVADDFKDKQFSLIQMHYLRGEILYHQGLLAQAMKEYNIVLSLQENHYWAMTRTGQIIWALDGDADRAINIIKEAIAINSQPTIGYQVLGKIYCSIGDIDDAISVYREVLQRDPEDFIASETMKNSFCIQSN